ncbi:hypothetical protein BN1088_1432292 [Sphingobacterium sp. PM2-P1-29]|nr:hypothetical protein BN1088_1432292 [Sphingobacterium sp. PM2-P1-29]
MIPAPNATKKTTTKTRKWAIGFRKKKKDSCWYNFNFNTYFSTIYSGYSCY